jgi:hypothetical protein
MDKEYSEAQIYLFNELKNLVTSPGNSGVRVRYDGAVAVMEAIQVMIDESIRKALEGKDGPVG